MRTTRRVQRHGAVALGLWTALAVSTAMAQQESRQSPTDLLTQQRLVDQQLAEQRRGLAPVNALLDFQYGGWIDYYVFHFDDGIQSQRVLQRPGLGVWTRFLIDDGAHEVFARMRLNFEYFNAGDEYDRQQDWIGPNFDRMWYEVNLGKALRLTKPGDPLQMNVRVGRQEVEFGTGYALDMPLDAVTLNGRIHDLLVTGLVGKTISSYPNIDRSEPVDSHSARRFFGVQLTWDGWKKHKPFVYALWNDDYTDERRKDRFQNYSYDTQYWGFGSRGEIVHNLNYWTEFAFETGRSYGDGDFISRDTVEAWAWDVGIEKLFDVAIKPRLAFEYMFASGDSDRIFSPTNAAGGNRRGQDTSFVGFGYRDTGISLAPAMSNLHVWKASGSMLPLQKIELLKDFEVGTNWFLYHKHHQRGAISDITADEFDGYVGWEMDYYINWRLSYDVSWTIRWGVFFPGEAYYDQDSRNFLFTGLTWSF